jgi:hypothetical protein
MLQGLEDALARDVGDMLQDRRWHAQGLEGTLTRAVGDVLQGLEGVLAGDVGDMMIVSPTLFSSALRATSSPAVAQIA